MSLRGLGRLNRDRAAYWMQARGRAASCNAPGNDSRVVVPTLAGSREWDGGGRAGVPEGASPRDDKRETGQERGASRDNLCVVAGRAAADAYILHRNRYQRRVSDG